MNFNVRLSLCLTELMNSYRNSIVNSIQSNTKIQLNSIKWPCSVGHFDSLHRHDLVYMWVGHWLGDFPRPWWDQLRTRFYAEPGIYRASICSVPKCIHKTYPVRVDHWCLCYLRKIFIMTSQIPPYGSIVWTSKDVPHFSKVVAYSGSVMSSADPNINSKRPTTVTLLGLEMSS